MILGNVTPFQIGKAASRAGVAISQRGIRPEGSRYRVTLAPTLNNGGKVAYQRRSHTGRKVAAVCWHGHRAFMRELFKLAPDALIITSISWSGKQKLRYEGSEHFEAIHESTGGGLIGSISKAIAYKHACDCKGGE